MALLPWDEVLDKGVDRVDELCHQHPVLVPNARLKRRVNRRGFFGICVIANRFGDGRKSGGVVGPLREASKQGEDKTGTWPRPGNDRY